MSDAAERNRLGVQLRWLKRRHPAAFKDKGKIAYDERDVEQFVKDLGPRKLPPAAPQIPSVDSVPAPAEPSEVFHALAKIDTLTHMSAQELRHIPRHKAEIPASGPTFAPVTRAKSSGSPPGDGKPHVGVAKFNWQAEEPPELRFKDALLFQRRVRRHLLPLPATQRCCLAFPCSRVPPRAVTVLLYAEAHLGRAGGHPVVQPHARGAPGLGHGVGRFAAIH